MATLDRKRLADTLKMGRVCAQRVLALLEQERQALADRDGAAIEKIIPLKIEAFERWEQTEQQRLTLLHEAGFTPDNAGMEQCLEQLESIPQFRTAWQKLLDLTVRCREENDTNGTMIEVNRRHTTEALAILSGQPIRPTGYAASGNAQRSADHRLLGEA